MLDIGDRESSTIKLHKTHGLSARYACLSHCWGGHTPLRLLQGNLALFEDDLPHGKLPKTFQDAIKYCRLLGLRYLWIDSLCIIQDSTEDWRIESLKMAQYYSQCVICVAATQGANGTAGLIPFATPMPPKMLRGSAGGKSFSFYFRQRTVDVLHEEDGASKPLPLLTRAWVYQERLLAPRVIHFGPAELVFECRQDTLCECGSARRRAFMGSHGVGVPSLAFGTSTPVKDALDGTETWRSMAEEYAELALTFQADKLPAFSGLAQFVQARALQGSVPLGRYLAGIWERSLVKDLTWNTKGALVARAKEYVAPSWSWMSSLEKISYKMTRFQTDSLCDIKHIEVSTEGSQEFGRVTSGFVVIEACILQVGWYGSWQEPYIVYPPDARKLIWEDFKAPSMTDMRWTNVYGARLANGELVAPPHGVFSKLQSWAKSVKLSKHNHRWELLYDKEDPGSVRVEGGARVPMQMDYDYHASGPSQIAEDEVLYALAIDAYIQKDRVRIPKRMAFFRCLILRRLSQDQFERVGLASITAWENKALFKALIAEVRSVKIV